MLDRRISQELAETLRDQADRARRAPILAEQHEALNDAIRGQRRRQRDHSDSGLERLFGWKRPDDAGER